MKYTKIIGFILSMVVFAKMAFAFPEKWIEKSASFTIIKSDFSELKLKNTPIGALAQATGKDVPELVNADGKIIYFKIKYTAPIHQHGEATAKTSPIIHYGLYESLSPELKARLSDHMTTPVNIKIGYSELDPIAIQCIFDEKLFPLPMMITDTIED